MKENLERLYKKNESMINLLKAFYAYNFFSEEECNNIIMASLIEAQDEYQENRSFSYYLNDKIREIFRLSLRNKMSFENILNVFVDSYLFDVNKDNLLEKTNYFLSFLDKYDICLNENTVENLYHNNVNFHSYIDLINKEKGNALLSNTSFIKNRSYKNIIFYLKSINEDNEDNEDNFSSKIRVENKVPLKENRDIQNISWHYEDTKSSKTIHIKSLYEIFNEVKKETVDKAVSLLSKEEVLLLQSRFTDNYASNTLSSNWDETKVKEFSDLVYVKLNGIINTLCLSNSSRLPLYTILNKYSKDILLLCIHNLSKYDREFLYKLYGTSLNEEKDYIMTMEESYHLQNDLIPKIREYIKRISVIINIKGSMNLESIYINNARKQLRDGSYVTKLENYMKTEEFLVLRDKLSLEESLIYVLSMGIIDDKYYRPLTVGNILCMPPYDIEKILSNVVDKLDKNKKLKRKK